MKNGRARRHPDQSDALGTGSSCAICRFSPDAPVNHIGSQGSLLPQLWPAREFQSEAPSVAAAEPTGRKHTGVVESHESSEPLTFRSEVRNVNYVAAVYDQDGIRRDLGADDFIVFEDAAPTARYRLGRSAPFNLVIFLDLSYSTVHDREAMTGAAYGFLGTVSGATRRLALTYALADRPLQVISPLKRDREQLESSLQLIPELRGQSPLYDALVLAHAETTGALRSRNAIIVLTTVQTIASLGIGSPVQDGSRGASRYSLNELGRFLSDRCRPHARLIPLETQLLARRATQTGYTQAWKIMEGPSGAIGRGGCFNFRSLDELEPVYKQVAEGLRAVYTLASTPTTSEFDGGWLKLRLELALRAGFDRPVRGGYQAK
jgi:hypothetical protein